MRNNAVLDLSGERYSRLTVVAYAGNARIGTKLKSVWVCRCSCGVYIIANTNALRSGNTKSCGCLKHDHLGPITHGLAKHDGTRPGEYSVWLGIRRRCNNPRTPEYKNYGGRGIRLDKRWNDFPRFLKDVGPRPSPAHTIERKNNNGDYRPGNVRWATMREQQRNRRTNRLITFEGETQPLCVWAEKLGINASTVRDRLNDGWSVSAAFSRRDDARSHPIRFCGKTASVSELARSVGLRPEPVFQRLSAGWSIRRALSTPIRKSERA